jgi:hypothetical protein
LKLISSKTPPDDTLAEPLPNMDTPVTPLAPCGNGAVKQAPDTNPDPLLPMEQPPGEKTNPAFAGVATLTRDASGTTANAIVLLLLCTNRFALSTEVTISSKVDLAPIRLFENTTLLIEIK